MEPSAWPWHNLDAQPDEHEGTLQHPPRHLLGRGGPAPALEPGLQPASHHFNRSIRVSATPLPYPPLLTSLPTKGSRQDHSQIPLPPFFFASLSPLATQILQNGQSARLLVILRGSPAVEGKSGCVRRQRADDGCLDYNRPIPSLKSRSLSSRRPSPFL